MRRHDPGDPALPHSSVNSRGRRTLVRIAGYALGVALLVAAVWTITRQSGLAAEKIDALRNAPWWMVALLLAAPGLNWLITTLIFWVLLNRYGKVGRREMAALMAASWLLNNLPMRAGMLGRLAYHRLVNNIAAVNVARSVLDSIISSAAALGVSLLIVVVLIAAGESGWKAPVAVIILGIGGLLAANVLRREPSRPLWRYICAASLRLIDGVVWAMRYWLVFRLLHEPIPPTSALAIAVVSQAAGLLPVPIGLREWAVGLTASVLPPQWRAGAALGKDAQIDAQGGRAVGLGADILMRLTELAWAIPAGAVSAWWLWRRYHRTKRRIPSSPTPGLSDNE